MEGRLIGFPASHSVRAPLSSMATTHTFSPRPINPFQKPITGFTLAQSRTLRPWRTRSRKLPLPSVSGIWDALTGGNSSREAAVAIRRGMIFFRQGDVMGSLVEFDKAIKLNPLHREYLWQRGLSLYYMDRLEEAAEQFRLDVGKNPNDTEESIWCFLCEAQLYGTVEARRRFLAVGVDPRPVMREAYEMFKEGGDPEKFVEKFATGQPSECFYSSLYAGLYYESQKDTEKAKGHIIASCQSLYGSRSDDYMASLAKVHCQCRNWNVI